MKTADPGSAEADGKAAEDTSATLPTAQIRYAGFWRRLLAFLLDELAFTIGSMLAVGAIAGLLLLLGPAVGIPQGTLDNLAYGVPYIAYLPLLWLYCALTESSRLQGTLGKLVLGLRVTDLQLRRISFARASGRFWSKGVTLFSCMIGFLIAGFTKRKQALHDIIAGTLVVRKRSNG